MGKLRIKEKEEGLGIGEILWSITLTIAGGLLFALLGTRLDQSLLFFIFLGAIVGGITGILSSKLFLLMYTRTSEYQKKTFNNLVKHYFLTPFLYYLHLNELLKQPKFRWFALLIYSFIIADEEKLDTILPTLAEEMNKLQKEIFPERKTDWAMLHDDKRDKYIDTLNRLRKEKGNIPAEVNAIKTIVSKYRDKFPMINEFVPVPTGQVEIPEEGQIDHDTDVNSQENY